MRLFGKVDGSITREDRPMFFGDIFDLALDSPITLLGWAKIYDDFVTELKTNSDMTAIASNWASTRVFNGVVNPNQFRMGRNKGRLPFIEVDWVNPMAETYTNESTDANMMIRVRFHYQDKNTHSNRATFLNYVRIISSVIKSYTTSDIWRTDISVGEIQTGPISVYVDIDTELSIVLEEGALT